jgi:hypothetical protein
MKAYMIVDFDNPVSMKYSEIARESWEIAHKRGLLSGIELYQCVTEQTLKKHREKYNWQRSLAQIDGGEKNSKQMTLSEIAGMSSHWDLMRKQGEETERFFIMEHDAYLLDVDVFEECMEFMYEHDIAYANLGLYMSCYSYNRHAAGWFYDELTRNRLPINTGPYGVVERLYKNYATHYLSKRNYNDRQFQFMHPFTNLTKVGVGSHAEEMKNAYNYPAPDPVFGFPTPSTQVWSESLGVTQDHANYTGNPKTQRGSFYKIIP